MSRINLAASYGRRLEMCEYAAALRADGHTVTSRWLLGEHEWDDATVAAAHACEVRGKIHPRSLRFAIDDLADIVAADIVVVFAEPVRTIANSRGGRHVELGLAYAYGKRIILVGAPEHVFHLLPALPATDRAGVSCARGRAARRCLRAMRCQ